MTREDKRTLIEELKLKFKENQNFYLADASGMTVAQINNFRRVCYNKGVDYKVYKNTLIKKALDDQEADFTQLDEVLKGYSGILFSKEIGNLPAKILKDFRKKGSKIPALKAASIDSELYLGDENLDMLSNLKSKNELIADVIALLQSPAKNVISALKGGAGNKVAGLVKALAEREN